MLTIQVKYASGAELVLTATEVFVESCNTALVIVKDGGIQDDIVLCEGGYAEIKNANGVVIRTVGE